ncbi:Photosystem I reaction center subunit III [Chroococcidiopsis sp.]|uniref:Photosystem I reaction center subunit III n=1 Tax=Chroococcidiopsis sp. TaxID=3088168 RepID=UPI003F3DF243
MDFESVRILAKDNDDRSFAEAIAPLKRTINNAMQFIKSDKTKIEINMSRLLFTLAIAFVIWGSTIPTASAANSTLVPCSKSPAFQARMKNAPDTYYFNKPFKAYAKYELCGTDGLPHLPLDRLDRATDVLVPIGLFLYVAGFIGWSGRSYLRATKSASDPEMKEIFIDLPLALQSISKAVLWPVLALQEFLSGDLTARDEEIPISPR